MDDGIDAMIRSLANDASNPHERAAAYLIRFIERREGGVETKRRKPHEATVYLLESISRQAMEASRLAAQHGEDVTHSHEISRAIHDLRFQLEAVAGHHERTRADRRKTG